MPVAAESVLCPVSAVLGEDDEGVSEGLFWKPAEELAGSHRLSGAASPSLPPELGGAQPRIRNSA